MGWVLRRSVCMATRTHAQAWNICVVNFDKINRFLCNFLIYFLQTLNLLQFQKAGTSWAKQENFEAGERLNDVVVFFSFIYALADARCSTAYIKMLEIIIYFP